MMSSICHEDICSLIKDLVNLNSFLIGEIAASLLLAATQSLHLIWGVNILHLLLPCKLVPYGIKCRESIPFLSRKSHVA